MRYINLRLLTYLLTYLLTNSESGKITCGVPQRSVLGPLLFLLHVNDIGSSLPNTSIKLYVDDTNLFIFNNVVEDLQVDKILLLNNWFVANKLSLSLDKTCYTIFGASDADKVKNKFKNRQCHSTEG